MRIKKLRFYFEIRYQFAIRKNSWYGWHLLLFKNLLMMDQYVFEAVLGLLYCQKISREENFANFVNWSFIREIKFPRNLFFPFIREIKFPRKKIFSSFAKLNSSIFFQFCQSFSIFSYMITKNIALLVSFQG